MPNSRIMTNAHQVAQFALAGKATLTLKSLKSEDHLTYKIRQTKGDNPVHFVSALVRPETYHYVGMIKDKKFTLTRKSRMTPDNVRVRAMKWFCEKVLENETMPTQLEVRHEGCCGRCGRELTHPDSIDRGIGPECWKHFSS